MPRQTVFLLLAVTAVAILAAGTAPRASAQACGPIPPTPCGIDSQFLGGRWDISNITGSYSIGGEEAYDADADYTQQTGHVNLFDVQGSLDVEMFGGPEENYIDVACDGTVTGRASERITGSITKVPTQHQVCFPESFDASMEWDVTIERSFRIEGIVAGSGQLDVDFVVEYATVGIDGNYTHDTDCFWDAWSDSFSGFDITGSDESESVLLSGGYNPDGRIFTPTVTHQDEPWVKAAANRLQIYYQPDVVEGQTPPMDLMFFPGDSPPQPIYEQNEVLLQQAVTVTPSITFESRPKTPIVENLKLTEPSVYLTSVPVMTQAIATVDWRDGDQPRVVEFTFGGMTQTVPASGDEAIFTFDAGMPGSEITAVPMAGGERGQAFSIRVGRTSLPSWAGSPGNWSGQGGVTYSGLVNWPISLQTTQTISDLALFSGIWGIEGSASSTYNAMANSSGAPGSGDLTTSASFKFAGRGASLTMTGSNMTTLTCGELRTTGSGTVTVPGISWKKTLNPLTLIPGLSAAACGLGPFLCGAVNSFGVKANANANVSGTADFEASSGPFQFTGGSVTGSIGGSLSASIVPKPLSALAQVTLSGSADGCVTIQVPPDFELTAAGGSVTAMAFLSVFGLSASPSHTLPFGSGCGARRKVLPDKGLPNGWIPADGLADFATLPAGINGDRAVAVWSEPRLDASRPSGDTALRLYENGMWGDTMMLTEDVASDRAPAVALQADGTALVVWMRSEAPIPLVVEDLDAYAQTFRLDWALVNPQTTTVLDSGTLTNDGLHFGADLAVAGDGSVHLFWQSATDMNIAGTITAPVAIHHRVFANGGWQPEETVASGLAGAFGWRAAAYSEHSALVALTVDGDIDLTTDTDREIVLFQRIGTKWNTGLRLTLDTARDDAALPGFDPAGRPMVLWRKHGTQLVEWDFLTQQERIAYQPVDPELNDGIDAALQQGFLTSGGPGSAIVWADGHQLVLMRRLDDSIWSEPEPIVSDAGVQAPRAFTATGSTLRLVRTDQAFESGGGLDPLLSPVVDEIDFGPCVDGPECDSVFSDGFEAGAVR